LQHVLKLTKGHHDVPQVFLAVKLDLKPEMQSPEAMAFAVFGFDTSDAKQPGDAGYLIFTAELVQFGNAKGLDLPSTSVRVSGR
jgi:hypothetical protein